MASKVFEFVGGRVDEVVDLDLSSISDIDALKVSVSRPFGVVQPAGLSFFSGNQQLESLSDIEATQGPINVKVNGHGLRDVPGPTPLPVAGNYYQVFPDHLANNQRLFEKYGKVFQEDNFGNVWCQTNDPELAQIILTESEFFSKEILPGHPLYPIKNQDAGVFIADTSAPAWPIVHKFLSPAFGPKAVSHYAPIINQEVQSSFPVFDELESRNEAWNAYSFMLKLSSQTVGKIVLGKDFEHMSSSDAPLHRMVLGIAEALAINKRITSHGEWYSKLPFGDPVRLRNIQKMMWQELEQSIQTAEANGVEDLPLQEAALHAANVIDYLVRAADVNGKHLPKENLMPAMMIAAGAGFTTTSSLLSWCLYGFVTYEGVQARLLQELVDHDFDPEAGITAEQIEGMTELDHFVKEILRRHSPSYQPGRTAQRHLILPDGYRMDKGTVVIAAIHHIHRNAKIWNNPTRFDMDRWDTEEVKNRHKTSYIPFAPGQRGCIGYNFALLEAKIFVCHLVYRYHWVKEGEMDTEYDPFFQLIRPVNLYMRTQKRTVWPSKSDS